MKKLGFIITLLLISFTGIAQNKNGVTITVNIENVFSNDGSIMASLHTTETFMQGPGIMNTNIKAKKGEATLTFDNVEPGTFAIIIMHDANDNKQMDRELNGMPKEHYATSGSTSSYGPPIFSEAKFEITNEDKEFKIRF